LLLKASHTLAHILGVGGQSDHKPIRLASSNARARSAHQIAAIPGKVCLSSRLNTSKMGRKRHGDTGQAYEPLCEVHHSYFVTLFRW
jgi:hypothetical protein